MGDKPEGSDKKTETAASLFVSQEQFETVQNKLIEKFTNANVEQINKLTEALKIMLPAKSADVTPSAPVASNKEGLANTRLAEFHTEMKKAVEWFAKTKATAGKTKVSEITGVGWNVPSDLYLGRLGYDVNEDIEAGSHKKAVEDITFSSKPRKEVKKFVKIAGSRLVVPVRQYCDFQQLEGEATAVWYSFDGFDFGAITEGSAPSAVTQTITQITLTPSIAGALQKIGYTQIEDAPAPLVDAINAAAVIAGIDAEATELLTTTLGTVTPTNWVNGNTGAVITADDYSGKSLKVDGLLAAKRLIRKKGYDVSQGNLVGFVSPQAYDELLLDVVNYSKYTRMSEIDLGTVEQVVGMDLVIADQVKSVDRTTNDAYRNVVAVKGQAFGMASARDLSIEASRRNEYQQVYLTATQRVASKILDDNAWCRVSTTATDL